MREIRLIMEDYLINRAIMNNCKEKSSNQQDIKIRNASIKEVVVKGGKVVKEDEKLTKRIEYSNYYIYRIKELKKNNYSVDAALRWMSKNNKDDFLLFKMYYIKKMSRQDIAKVLSLSVGTVSDRIKKVNIRFIRMKEYYDEQMDM